MVENYGGGSPNKDNNVRLAINNITLESLTREQVNYPCNHCEIEILD